MSIFFLFSKKPEANLINLPGGPVGGNSRRRTIISLAIVLIVITWSSFYFWKEVRISDNSSATSGEFSGSETEGLIKKVGDLMILPSDETPTVATVSDPEKLNNQPFFVGAKEGDKVLIYSKSQKAILYDPVANKIVNVAPINLGN